MQHEQGARAAPGNAKPKGEAALARIHYFMYVIRIQYWIRALRLYNLLLPHH